MIEAVKFWNEPNNKSHWDFENLDPEWTIFSDMVSLAGQAVAAENPQMTRVLGGMSPISSEWVQRLWSNGALEHVDVVAVHGFPLDWNHWTIHEWPSKIDEIRAVTDKEVWVTEVGISTFGAEEVQEWGLHQTASLLIGKVPRIHWYSLYDLPRAWPATTRHREAEGSSYYRHFYLGLLREDGSPKPAYRQFQLYAPEMGICQWFHYEDHRLDDAVRWLRKLGVKHLRTGISWADSFRPNAMDWFDRQMRALEEFDVTVTFCFTPEHCSLALDHGLPGHHTSPPRNIEEYADFCASIVRRYAPGATLHAEPVTALA
jgi:beta-xylosidase